MRVKVDSFECGQLNGLHTLLFFGGFKKEITRKQAYILEKIVRGEYRT